MQRLSYLSFIAGLTLIFLSSVIPHADAHPLTFTATTLTLKTDNTFEVDLQYDLDALALGVSITTDDAELVQTLEALPTIEFNTTLERLRRLFERRVRVRFDGTPIPFTVDFPDYGTTQTTTAEIPTVLGLTARLVGNIPENPETVEFFASRAFASVHLTIVDEIRNREVSMVLEQGARSTPFEFSGQYEEPGGNSVAQQYFWLGVQHIVPNGFDHILFVVGLFLLSLKIRPLVTQVTAFTLAHALTLTAAVLGFVTLSPQLVEPLIAASVAYIAIENIVTDKLTPWRPFVVFGFGLLHGLGFANSLSALGLPDQERLFVLVMFNAGIEIGQLAVIAVAAATFGWCRNKSWYRPWIVIPASAVIATTGIIWAIQRASGL